MRRISILALAAVVAIITCGAFAGHACASDTKAWRLLAESPAFPPTLEVPLGVYDPVRHRVLAIDAAYVNQPVVVYVFDPAPEPHWSTLAVSDTVPQQRYLASIVYDPLRDRLLLFGGLTPAVMDVWALALSGSPKWQMLASQGITPQPRGGQSTTYDPVHDRVMLFAGMDRSYPATYLSDVWALALSSNTWSALVPAGAAPGGREGHGAIYDPDRNRMLVFGGHFDNGARGFWNDVWELSLGDTLAWSEIRPAGPIPGARSAFGTVYDPVRQRMLIHGGVNVESGVDPDELWALSLAGSPAWTKIATEDTLRGRSYPIDVYDPAQDRLLACGGGGYPQTSALALSDPVRWNAVLPPRPLLTPSKRTGHMVVSDTRRDRFLVLGGQRSTADSAMWFFDPEALSPWRPVNAPPEPGVSFFDEVVPAQGALYDSLGDRIIMCNGTQAWSSPAAGPREWAALGPRAPTADLGYGAGLALDTRRNRLIVSGGWIFVPHTSDYTVRGVWALSLGPDPTWSLVGTLPHPYGVTTHASFYDRARDRLLVMGGYERDGGRRRGHFGSTVWSTPLDSTLRWTTLNPTAGPAPPGPPDARALFDSQRNRAYTFADSTVWSRELDGAGPWTEMQFSTRRPVVSAPVVYDPIRDEALALFASTGSDSVQAWAIALGPLSVSLVNSVRMSNGIELTWRSTTAIGRAATIERREPPADWVTLGPIAFDVRGFATFTDHRVRVGHDYSYRASVVDGDSTWHSDPILVAPPASLRLALLGARPNPAVGTIQLTFTLPGTGPARLELFDVRGRRCLSREVGALGTGTHWLTLEESGSLRPGVYFARLGRGGETRTARMVLMR